MVELSLSFSGMVSFITQINFRNDSNVHLNHNLAKVKNWTNLCCQGSLMLNETLNCSTFDDAFPQAFSVNILSWDFVVCSHGFIIGTFTLIWSIHWSALFFCVNPGVIRVLSKYVWFCTLCSFDFKSDHVGKCNSFVFVSWLEKWYQTLASTEFVLIYNPLKINISEFSTYLNQQLWIAYSKTHV